MMYKTAVVSMSTVFLLGGCQMGASYCKCRSRQGQAKSLQNITGGVIWDGTEAGGEGGHVHFAVTIKPVGGPKYVDFDLQGTDTPRDAAELFAYEWNNKPPNLPNYDCVAIPIFGLVKFEGDDCAIGDFGGSTLEETIGANKTDKSPMKMDPNKSHLFEDLHVRYYLD